MLITRERDAAPLGDAINMVPNPRLTSLFGWGSINCLASLDTTFPGYQEGIAHNGLHLYGGTDPDSFADLGDGVLNRLSGFADDQTQ